jgi:DNA-binding MarR family transcriptional regulator
MIDMSNQTATEAHEDISEACAQQVLDAVPAIMRFIASGVHCELEDGRWLTMGQFRLLHLIEQGVGSVSELAEHQNVSLPSISRQVDGLVKKGLVVRQPSSKDRRVIQLALSNSGAQLLDNLMVRTQQRVAQTLSPLTPSQKQTVLDGLTLLQHVVG